MSRGGPEYLQGRAWSLAQHYVKKAQKVQRKFYDRRSRSHAFCPSDRVFVYMPKEKASKAYKFTCPYHGPYRVTEALDTGVVVRPVNKPDDKSSIRVALNRVHRCPDPVPDDVFWPEKQARPDRRRRSNQRKSLLQWKNQLKQCLGKDDYLVGTSSEDALTESRDM